MLVSNGIEYWSNYSIRNFEYSHSTNIYGRLFARSITLMVARCVEVNSCTADVTVVSTLCLFMLQPRRVAAVTVAQRVANEKGSSLGSLVGRNIPHSYSLSWRQTIDKVGQLLGRGLVSEDNRPMKSLNHDTCHLSRHDSDDKKMADDKDADAFMLLYFLTAKQHKKRTIWVRRWLLDR